MPPPLPPPAAPSPAAAPPARMSAAPPSHPPAPPAQPSSSSSSSSSSSASASASSSTTAPSTSASARIGGVPIDFGKVVDGEPKKQLQRQINHIIAWHETDRAPLTIPQALLRANASQIAGHPYFVSEKSVGIHYLVVLVQGYCYLVTPSYDVRVVTLFSPVRPDRLQPGMDRSTIVPHQWTILDGLLVCDTDGAKSAFTMLIYDILALNGTPVMTSKLQDRLKLIQNDVIAPTKTIPRPAGQPPDPFQLVQQFMYPVNRVAHVIRSIVPRVSQTRQNAGLMFTPAGLAYAPGYAQGIFTWTPTALLSACFQLGVEWRGRPPTPGFKLIVHENRTQVFHDWITFSPEEFESFRQDRKASSRLIECVYDSEWLTFVPSHDKTSWDIGSPDLVGTERGQGWRKGGWRLVRCRPDKSMPIERSALLAIERAIGEDMKMDEIERLFPEKPTKKPAPAQQKPREPPPAHEQEYQPVKKKGTGVCYDFQNKGVCQRGSNCHFSHCACNSTCVCTPTKNTYGQRPSYRRNDYDAPPSSDAANAIDGSTPSGKPHVRSADTYERERSNKRERNADEEEAGELMESVGKLNPTVVFAELESFDADALAKKAALIAAYQKQCILEELGIAERGQRKRPCGLVVSKAGEIEWIPPHDK